MPREKDAFRDNLERLDTKFPGKELLTKTDVVNYTGVCYAKARNIFRFKGNYISKAVLASDLSADGSAKTII